MWVGGGGESVYIFLATQKNPEISTLDSHNSLSCQNPHVLNYYWLSPVSNGMRVLPFVTLDRPAENWTFSLVLTLLVIYYYSGSNQGNTKSWFIHQHNLTLFWEAKERHHIIIFFCLTSVLFVSWNEPNCLRNCLSWKKDFVKLFLAWVLCNALHVGSVWIWLLELTEPWCVIGNMHTCSSAWLCRRLRTFFPSLFILILSLCHDFLNWIQICSF